MKKKIIRQDWDTSFFGFNVARIDIKYDEAIDLETINTRGNDYKLLYLFSSYELAKPFYIDANCSLVDIKLLFTKRLIKGTGNKPDSNIVEYFDGIDINKLYDLAFISGKYSRFNIDKNIPNTKFKELYRKWVDNSLNGLLASKVFVYLQNFEAVGFVTVSIKKSHGAIGLIAVDPRFHGMSIGSKLLRKVESYLVSCDVKLLSVPTQERNQQAVKFYLKNNFTEADKTYIYHFWN